jgi:hypothetical protein
MTKQDGTTAAALLEAGVIPIVFVLPFYLNPRHIGSDRNAAATVWYRMTMAVLSGSAIVALVHNIASCGQPLPAWLGIGLDVNSAIRTCKLLLALYAGNLIQVCCACRMPRHAAELLQAASDYY